MDGSKILGGGSAGAGLGAAAVYVASRFGAHLTSEDGALIATGAIAVGAFLVHNGIRGSLAVLWRGSSSSAQDGNVWGYSKTAPPVEPAAPVAAPAEPAGATPPPPVA